MTVRQMANRLDRFPATAIFPMSTASAFPSLDDEQMGHVRRLGERTDFRPGDVLIRSGQKDYPFFVFESGEVEILEEDDDRTTLITTHGPGEFSGDVDMMTGRSSLFTARAKTTGTAYSLPASTLRKLLGACPRLGDMFLDAFQMRRGLLKSIEFSGVRMIGQANTPESSALQEFFYKNHVPYTFYEADSEAGRDIRHRLNADDLEPPIVRCNGHTLGNPALLQIARCIGIHQTVDQQTYDLAIVGSGPSGLAAAVYAASEGIRVLVLDRVGPGGQAGSSSKIENFMGFPSGLSGSELANRGYLQALKFGATFIAPEQVVGVESGLADGQTIHHLALASGQTVKAKCVLVASGVTYRQLDLPGCKEFEGAGVYYAATSVEARACEGQNAVVVGGGNSAGQAAMFLAETARRVHLLIRGDDLGKSMSSYLCDRVLQHPKIELHRRTEVTEVCGENSVDRVHLRQAGEAAELACAGLFIFIGARPHSDWLPEDVAVDEKGFVLTGSSFFTDDQLRKRWPLDRAPCELETSRPGIMASGDVRSGTTKRCGFAVGDGSLAIACVHRYLGGQL